MIQIQVLCILEAGSKCGLGSSAESEPIGVDWTEGVQIEACSLEKRKLGLHSQLESGVVLRGRLKIENDIQDKYWQCESHSCNSGNGSSVS